MKLYDYQQKAVDLIMEAYSKGENIAPELATGSGKSIIIAECVRIFTGDGKKVLILQPTTEILKQNKKAITDHLRENQQTCKIEVYSAKMGKRVESDITLATIGSIVTNAKYEESVEYDEMTGQTRKGRKVIEPKRIKLQNEYDIIIIDEAHMVDWATPNSKYRFLIDRLNVPTYGLTATPFRSMWIYEGNITEEEAKDKKIKIDKRPLVMSDVPNLESYKDTKILPIFKSCPKVISIEELQDMGRLITPYYFDKFDGSITEYNKLIQPEYPDIEVDQDYWYQQHLKPNMKVWCNSISKLSEKLNSILVFCPDVKSAEEMQKFIPNSFTITGETKNKARKNEIMKFKNLTRKVILNVGCLTTGFDYKGLDCIIMLRPTKSYNLYVQMIGRILRTHELKETGYIIDYSGSLRYFGKIGKSKN